MSITHHLADGRSNGIHTDILPERLRPHMLIRKRAAEELSSENLRKRPKLRSTADQSFKFLDLPGELHNRIYELAAEDAHRCFPMIHQTTKKRARNAKHLSPQEAPKPQPKPIPYIGLTQTCAQIRAEFRPLWLSSHRIPLEYMDSYTRAFFPVRLPKAVSVVSDALGPARLRVWIRKVGPGYPVYTGYVRDVTQLLKFRARFPECVVTTHSLAYKDKCLQDLNRIINYVSTVWRKSLSGRSTISQVRFRFDLVAEEVHMNVVVKEKHSEPWMKALCYLASDSETDSFMRRVSWYQEAVGAQVGIQLSVDYS